jgi:hypothetical protein
MWDKEANAITGLCLSMIFSMITGSITLVLMGKSWQGYLAGVCVAALTGVVVGKIWDKKVK